MENNQRKDTNFKARRSPSPEAGSTFYAKDFVDGTMPEPTVRQQTPTGEALMGYRRFASEMAMKRAELRKQQDDRQDDTR